MNISKKWSVAAAALLSLALVGGGAVSANAAVPAPGDPTNPQTNGSKGSFFLWDGNTGLLADDTARVYTRTDILNASASSTDILAEINPAPARPVTGATAFTGVYRFISDRNAAAVAGGTNTWKSFAIDAAAGPNSGTMLPDMTLDAINSNINAVIAQGGQYWYGVAYTTNNGVTTVGAVYREITIEAGTGNYTVGPVEVQGPAPAHVITEPELVAPATATLNVPVDSTVVSIDAGAANANKTLKVAAFLNGARVELGSVVFDATGKSTFDVAGKGFGFNTDYKLFAYELGGALGTDEVLASWGTFKLTQSMSTNDTTALTATVTSSNRFELVAPAAATVDLGATRRNTTTAPVALGQFTVFDDRDVLAGWNLNVNATDFAGPANSVVSKDALGYAPVAVALTPGVTLGAAKTAGSGVFGIIAEGAVGSSTADVGAVLNTSLTFKAPINAVKGVHTSTLTLDLVSK
ncbi:hypothetical protein [Agromyces bauzanensis]